MRPIISPRDLAEAIGVSESSLKRWADGGLIEVSRTAGGHRRIAIGEAIRFIRATRAPLVRPDVLGLSDLSTGGEHVVSAESPSDQLFAHLRDGHAREARGVILSQYLAGQSVAQIADGPIRTAMERIGELWKHDLGGVYVEHRAVDICMQAVHQLRELADSKDHGGLALGGAPPGDPYLLPSLLVATALASEGWGVVNLGPDTPFESFLVAADRHKPRIVWLSVSSVRDAGGIARGVERTAHSLAERGITLVVGGRALSRLSLPAGLLRPCRLMADLMVIAKEVQASGRGRPGGAARAKPDQKRADHEGGAPQPDRNPRESREL